MTKKRNPLRLLVGAGIVFTITMMILSQHNATNMDVSVLTDPRAQEGGFFGRREEPKSAPANTLSEVVCAQVENTNPSSCSTCKEQSASTPPPDGSFSSKNNEEGFCDDFAAPLMPAGSHPTRLPSGPEQLWCTVRHSKGTTGFPAGLLVITNRGGCNDCQTTMDVRFADGTILLDSPLSFSEGNRLLYNLTQAVAYILVKRTHSDEHCDFNAPLAEARQVITFRADPDRQLPKGVRDLAPQNRLEFLRTIEPVGAQSTASVPGITVYTQLDAERLPSLAQLVRSIEFPFSAALFYDGSQEMLQYIDTFLATTEDGKVIRRSVRLHLVHNSVRDVKPKWARKPFPVQELRNIALKGAQTEYVILVEADMVFPPGAGQALLRERDALQKLSKVASILPLYAPREDVGAGVLERLPNNKKGLRQAGLIPCPYDSHEFMDYKAWETREGMGPVTPLNYVREDTLREDICGRSFVEGKPQCSVDRILQEGDDAGWGVEPYFLARQTDLPLFDPAIRYGHFDKIDQLRF